MPPTKKTIGLREVRVGIFILVAIAVLIVLILNASGDISFKAKKHLNVRFASADGLRPGAEVRLAGVRIGKVDDVKLLPPSDTPGDARVEARLSVDSTVDGKPITDLVRTDSKAQLTSPSLLGSDKVIAITMGTSLGQPIHENDYLRTTTEGGMAQLTESGNQLVDQLNKLSEQMTGITSKINQGQGSIGRFVNDEAFYDNLNLTVREAQGIMREIRSGQGTAAKLVNDPALYNNVNQITERLGEISDNLNRGRGTAGKLLTDDALYNEARSTIARLNRTADDINGITAEIRAGHGTAGKLLKDEALYNDARSAIARFNTTAERVDNIVASVQRGDGSAGKLLYDDQLYNNVNQLSSESVKLLYDFRQNPKKYLTIKFSIF
ncbi:MAG: phospholipid/cholesterol/gamma-HCH transport system substrate-binding protein [Acidobacteriota bacterium]|nr:phospholipid/cholesterol/gamma-HCH transport system substrate-binding protein [Acidobacteriota bacterium]